MIVTRLTSYKEPSPFKNFSVLPGEGEEEEITSDMDFDYALQIPWEDPPICLLTERGLRTLVQMNSINPAVGKLKITPLEESNPNLPRFFRIPMTTISVAELLELKQKTSLVAVSN